MIATSENPLRAATPQTEIPKSLPTLIVRYSWPKLIFCCLAVLGFAVLQIWILINPWLISFSHPDFTLWNGKLLVFVAIIPFFFPFWLVLVSSYVHILRQTWRGEAVAIISDNGVFSPNWGYTIPWDKMNYAFIMYGLFLFWSVHRQKIVIRAPVFLRPLQPKAQTIFALFFYPLFDGRSIRGDVAINLIGLENKYAVIERFEHYLGKRLRK